MNSDQLLSFFRRGLIPGPDETEADFLRRVQERSSLQLLEWGEVAPTLLKQWGFVIDWAPLLYSSKKLLPWEGAAFWSGDNEKPLIQLKPSLKTKTILGNSRQEILLHEALHAARETFQEPQFEEVLAYAFSSKEWKKWLGPLLTHGWELFFVLSALLLLPFLPWVSIPCLAFFCFRVCYKQLIFQRLKKKLPPSILLCLTDAEMKALAFGKMELLQLDNGTLRWKMIRALYEGVFVSKPIRF